MSLLPRHSRPVPAEWNDLLAQSGRNLAAGPGPATAREQMYRTVDRLPDERLEANRYYALGSAGCYYVRQVADGQVRTGIVERAAGMMARRNIETAARRSRPPGIRFQDMHAAGLDSAANPVAATIDGQLAPPVKLLADALNTAGMVRICLAEDRDLGQGAPVSGFDGAATVRMLYRRGEPITARRVTQNSLAGAMSVYRRAVQARFFPDGPPPDEPDPRLFDTVTAAELTALQPLAVGRKTAGLRADEHASPLLDELLVGDRHGNLQFRRDRLGPPPVVRPPDSVRTAIHESRLACPALQVDGAILQSLQLIPDIIIRAQELVEG